MNLEVIKTAITSRTARQILLGKKHAPTILFVAGTIGVVTSTVLACRATLKVGDVLETVEKGQAILGDEKMDGHLTEEQHAKAVRTIQIKAALEIAKLYALPVAVGAISIGALTGAQVVLTRRNTAVMAAYAAVDQAFKKYRQEVMNEFGEDTDRKFLTNAKTVHVEEKVSEGTTKITQKSEKDIDSVGSGYAVLFDEKSQHWTPMPGGNENILQMKQNWANDKLKAKGHITLNEVYDLLDLPRTKAGFVVGWVYDPKNKNHLGDNFVSFGVFDNEPEQVERFLNGNEKNIWLDFNVDGMIYDKI